jgi:hypothetical protein
MLDHYIRAAAHWWMHTRLNDYMNGWWEYPIAESLHFIGLSLLIGTVGMFDLRLIGVGRRIPLSALHRLIPWGVGGYVLNVLTGLCFLSAMADQYMYNPAFLLKLLSMGIAGVNVALFYTTMWRKVATLGPGEHAPLPARIMGGVSLVAWMGVMTFGRLLTFYRPPFYWCPWCF